MSGACVAIVANSWGRAARAADRLGAELLLAAGEEVVDRPERGVAACDDLLDAGAGVALAAKQLGARVDDALLGGAGHVGPLIRLDARRWASLLLACPECDDTLRHWSDLSNRWLEVSVPEVELSAGTIEYEDTGGPGPVIVFVHGLMMDGSLWRHVVADLRRDYRCVLPTLPLGAHRRPMRPTPTCSMRGMVEILGELIQALDLSEITLAMSDWGGPCRSSAAPMMSASRGSWCARARHSTTCRRKARRSRCHISRGSREGSTPPCSRFGSTLRRLPMTYGPLSKRPVPREVMDRWFGPIRQREIRRDLRKYVRSAPQGRRELLAGVDALAAFDRPALIAWASEDRLMPPEHGRRLADLLPQGHLVEIADSYTLVPEDQPAKLTAHMREFLARGVPAERHRAPRFPHQSSP